GLLGMRSAEKGLAALTEALGDKDPFVRRRACEALVRSHGPIPVAKLLPLLDDPDRWIRYAARVAVEHGDVAGSRAAILAAASPRAIDREIARLLAYLGEPRAVAKILDAQGSDPDHATQIHYTYCLRVLKEGWTNKDKTRLWAWYETASHWDGGFSFLGYLD